MASLTNLEAEGLPVLASQLQEDSPSAHPSRNVQLESDSDEESISSDNQTPVTLPEEAWQDAAQDSSLLPMDLPGQEASSNAEEELEAAHEALQASLRHLILKPSSASHATQAEVQDANSGHVGSHLGADATGPDGAALAEAGPRHSMSELGAAGSSGQQRSWESYSKHVLVLTSSGKPIYSLHGDPDSLAGLMALAMALISVVADHGDKLQHISSGGVLTTDHVAWCDAAYPPLGPIHCVPTYLPTCPPPNTCRPYPDHLHVQGPHLPGGHLTGRGARLSAAAPAGAGVPPGGAHGGNW
jgi:hypothetical protein